MINDVSDGEDAKAELEISILSVVLYMAQFVVLNILK